MENNYQFTNKTFDANDNSDRLSDITNRKMFQKKNGEERVPKNECPFFKKKQRSNKMGMHSEMERLRTHSRFVGTLFFLKKRAFIFLESIPCRSNSERREMHSTASLTR